MKKIIPFAAIMLMVGTAFAADSGKDEITAAAKKLAAENNYSWKTTVESPGGNGRFRPGPTEGKTEKDGYTSLSMTRGDNTLKAILKDKKGALKTQDGEWESLADAADDQGPAQFAARMLQNFKAPAAEAESLASKTKELQVTDGTYSGDLTEDGAKSLLTFGRGGNGPEVSEAKGSAKFWIKDGTLSKFEFKVQGHVEFNGNGRDVNRTTTVEIKDIGSTKVEVPDDAKKKVS